MVYTVLNWFAFYLKLSYNLGLFCNVLNHFALTDDCSSNYKWSIVTMPFLCCKIYILCCKPTLPSPLFLTSFLVRFIYLASCMINM
jgi:hypothetical protein